MPAAAPTASADVPGPRSPRSWYQTRLSSVACEPVPEPREEPGVPLAPDGVERERTVAGVVIAERRDRALGDRKLDLHRADHGDDLRDRLAAGEHVRRRHGPRRDRCRRPRAERGQQQGQQQHRRKECEHEKSRGVPLGPPPARAQALQLLRSRAVSGSTRAHRVAVSGRSHGRHHSRPCRNPPTAGSVTARSLRKRLDGRGSEVFV